MPFAPASSADSSYLSSPQSVLILLHLPARSCPTNSLSTLRRPLSLADLLTSSRTSSIAYDYIRDSPLISSLLIAPAPRSYTTLLIPTNSAIMALHRKPHQGPAPTTAPVINGEVNTLEESEKEKEQASRDYLE
ncbi:hypothetical protein P7C70_g9634, partial [Phenoliferia sp. Uapishka_3]